MEQGPPRREIVELRVHGVHGTAPAAMLGVEQSDVRQVAGDNLTGLYRSRSGELPYRSVATDAAHPDRAVVSVEAYSWGALTSGVRGILGWLQRALWLLLLPFALANLAYWARLSLDGSKPAARWGARFSRLGALLLTVFMVLVPCLVAVDLVAWQCYRGDSPGCTPLPGLLDFMADLRAGQRLAVASIAPLLFVGLLWFLSRQSLVRYEEVTLDEALDQALDGAGDGQEREPVGEGPFIVLRHRNLWNGKKRTLQLQRAHLTIAVATVVAFSGVHVASTPHGDTAGVRVVLFLTGAVALAAVAWTLTLHPDDVESANLRDTRLVRLRTAAFTGSLRGKVGRWVRNRLPGALLVAMLGVAAVHAAALWWLPRSLEQNTDFVGHNLWFIGVFVALTAVHMVMFTGDRMAWPGVVAAVTVVALLAAGAVAAHLDRLPWGFVTSRVLVGAVIAFFVVLAFWHGWRGSRDRHRAQAWNGAGASVLLASAGWVMLLFTTGGVTAAANYLNGDEHGVDDVVSELADDRRSTAVDAVVEPRRRPVFEVSGEVVVKDAVITLGAGRSRPLIRSGTVEAERVYDVDPGRMKDLNGAALQKGRVRLAAGLVLLDSDRLRIQDSCVRIYVTSPCSPESSRFLVGGRLQLPKPVLRIDGEDWVELVPTDPPAVPLVVPQVLIWAPLAQTLWLVATLVWAGLAYWVFVRRARAPVEKQVRADGIPERDQAACVKARLVAGFAHRAERIIDGVGLITSVLVVALIVASATGEAPWVDYEWLRPFATVGMFVALGTGLALVLLASRVRVSEDTRRAVGVLWDLTTFWPRAAHPLAPPCYAERVVPELRTRAQWVLHAGPGGATGSGTDPRRNNLLVLSGHSQGSVIVCAVLSRMHVDDLARTRVITYGSQIRALYGRVFPGVFGPDQIGYDPTVPTRLTDPFPDAPAHRARHAAAEVDARAAHRLIHRVVRAEGAWVNLFRRSDPLGYRVFGDHDSDHDRYVPEVPDVTVGDAGPRVNTHSGYQHTRGYRQAVAEWTGEEVQEDPVSTADLPAVPV